MDNSKKEGKAEKTFPQWDRLRMRASKSFRGAGDRLSEKMNGIGDLSKRRRIVLLVFLCGLVVIALNVLRLRLCRRQPSALPEVSVPEVPSVRALDITDDAAPSPEDSLADGFKDF